MSEVFTNNAASVLASGISDSDTTVTVNAGDGAEFPSPTGSDYFRVVMIKVSNGAVEIAKVLSRSTDVLDFDDIGNRGLEGTTPLALSANDIIELRPTAAFFTSLTNAEEVQDGEATYGIDSGAADAYVLTMTPTMTAYAAGQKVNFIPLNDNTGPSVVTIDGIAGGAIDIKYQSGAALIGGEIDASGINTIEYDGTNFILLDPTIAAIEGVTAGTAANNKMVVLDGSKQIDEMDAVVLKKNTVTLEEPNQAEAEAGTAEVERLFTALRVKQAIAALGSTDDEKAKVSADDTTPGYLNGKLTATAPITLTENDGGGNETLDIGFSGVDRSALSTGTVSLAGLVGATGVNIAFAQSYVFFPMIHIEGLKGNQRIVAHSIDGASANSPRLGLWATVSQNYDVDYRYIAA